MLWLHRTTGSWFLRSGKMLCLGFASDEAPPRPPLHVAQPAEATPDLAVSLQKHKMEANILANPLDMTLSEKLGSKAKIHVGYLMQGDGLGSDLSWLDSV